MKNKYLGSNFCSRSSMVAVLVMAALAAPAHASSGGMATDRCSSCHGEPTAGMTVAAGETGTSSTSIRLKQGELLRLTLTITGATNTSSTGFSSGIYGAGSGNPIPLIYPPSNPAPTLTGAILAGGGNNYFTHASTGTATPAISYKIPTEMPAGRYTIKSVALKGNGGGADPGDQWKVSNDVELIITSAAGAPGVPTNVIATSVNAQLSVAFTPNNGAATGPFNYTVNCNGAIGRGSASPVLVPGVQPDGASYTCTVTASNAAGTSDPSAPSIGVTPTARPGTPTGLTATPGNRQVNLSFTPAAGVAATRFNASCVGGGSTWTGSSTNPPTPLNVGNLTNATVYDCTVTAANVTPSGTLVSAPTAPVTVTPAGPPDAPAKPTLTGGNNQMTLAFAAPSSNGAQIRTYTATCRDIGVPANPVRTQGGSSLSLTVTGLANGNLHACSVTATNDVGTSDPSAEEYAATVAQAVPVAVPPGAPTITSVVAGNNQLTVNFSAPGNLGSGQLSGYSATCSTSGVTTAPVPGVSGATSIPVTGLANGTLYTCRVKVATTAGTAESAPSSPPVAPVAPVAAVVPPGAPTITSVVAGVNRLTVNFNAGDPGSGQVSGYSATCSTSGVTTAPFAGGTTATSIDVTGLASTSSYTCRVRITTTAGTVESAASSPSATPLAPAAAAPGRPTINSVTPGDKLVRVDFTPASSDAGLQVTYLAYCGIQPSAPASPPATGDQNSRSLTVTGLNNGVTYTCTVGAKIGSSSTNSLPSASVVPVAPTPVGKADIVFSSPPPTVNPQSVIPGGQVRLGPVTVFTLKNQGTAPTGPFRFGVYLSRDATITTADTFLNFASHDFNIAAGAEASFGNVNVTIPPDTTPGNYFIGILADDTNKVDESNENNNYVSSSITISAPAAGAKPDIMFTNPLIAVSPTSAAPGGQVRLDLNGSMMKNQGTAATGPFRFGVYLSRRPVIAASDISLNFFSNDFNLSAGGTAAFGSVIVTIPMGTPAGSYYIGILADDNNRVSESNENNNYSMVPITIR